MINLVFLESHNQAQYQSRNILEKIRTKNEKNELRFEMKIEIFNFLSKKAIACNI